MGEWGAEACGELEVCAGSLSVQVSLEAIYRWKAERAFILHNVPHRHEFD